METSERDDRRSSEDLDEERSGAIRSDLERSGATESPRQASSVFEPPRASSERSEDGNSIRRLLRRVFVSADAIIQLGLTTRHDDRMSGTSDADETRSPGFAPFSRSQSSGA